MESIGRRILRDMEDIGTSRNGTKRILTIRSTNSAFLRCDFNVRGDPETGGRCRTGDGEGVRGTFCAKDNDKHAFLGCVLDLIRFRRCGDFAINEIQSTDLSKIRTNPATPPLIWHGRCGDGAKGMHVSVPSDRLACTDNEIYDMNSSTAFPEPEVLWGFWLID